MFSPASPDKPIDITPPIRNALEAWKVLDTPALDEDSRQTTNGKGNRTTRKGWVSQPILTKKQSLDPQRNIPMAFCGGLFSLMKAVYDAVST
jgi:hypothetical protein